MTRLNELKAHLRPGQVYRREDLAKWSNAVDRHLKQLVDSNALTKLAGGLYYRPKSTAFGKAPAGDRKLVESFLKDDRFLLATPNAYNALGLGTTQLYNKTVVYNHKRHGQFNLGGRDFEFRVKPDFPSTLSKEFLLVDLVNNLDTVAEDADALLTRVRQRTKNFDLPRLLRVAKRFGNLRSRKFFGQMAVGTNGE
jgi:hypothetical protein